MDFLKRLEDNSDWFYMRKFLSNSVLAGVALAGMAGCAQPMKPAEPFKAMAVGSHFDQIGRVTLYAGEPCTPQIMFDFHGTRSTVWLAARMWETKILTEAANKNRRVHISGKWRRGGQTNCRYVEVASAELAE